jgi:hypothetical protein
MDRYGPDTSRPWEECNFDFADAHVIAAYRIKEAKALQFIAEHPLAHLSGKKK